MLARTPRPHMRLATAQLATMVDGAPAGLLAEIAAELAHRDRKPARALAARIAELMTGAAPAAYAPVADVIPCINGEIAPGHRDVVIDVAPAPRPARKAPVKRAARSVDLVADALAWLAGSTAGKREANRLRRALRGPNADHARAALLAMHAWRTRRAVLAVPPAAIQPSAPDWCEAFGWPSEAAWKAAAERAPRITAPAGTPASDAEHAAWRSFMAKARLAAVAAAARPPAPAPAVEPVEAAPARPATRRAAF